MRAPVRLGYCTNVLPGEDVAAVERNLERYAVKVRARLGAEPLGAGLWLAAPAAAELAADAGAAARLRAKLEENGLYAFTLNAFPYGGFHAERVKHDVYRPAWDDAARLRYTLDAARALARLLPEGAGEGTISTLPIAWRAAAADPATLARAGGFLAAALAGLAALERESGKRIRLLLEPEPGCRLETTADVLAARDIAYAFAEGRGVADVLDAHLGVCFDCCHQAVMGEDLVASLRALRAAGVRVGKMHLSSAIEGDAAALARYAEPRWLHQVVATDGRARADDLDAIARDPAWRGRRARAHVHVPIHRADLGDGVVTTQPALAAALAEALAAALAAGEDAPHLEVETYTWGVLPTGAAGFDVVESLAEELRWARARIGERDGAQ